MPICALFEVYVQGAVYKSATQWMAIESSLAPAEFQVADTQ